MEMESKRKREAAGVAGDDAKRQKGAPDAQAASKRAPPLLAWMRNAVLIDPARSAALSEVPGLDRRLQAAVRDGGVERLFPVQTAVWDALAGGAADAHDVCVNAPTGSGKTLAYALPVVAALSGRVIRRLRALVVLPTHDLAQQARARRSVACAQRADACRRRTSGWPCVQPAVQGSGPLRRSRVGQGRPEARSRGAG